jgi:hypothetical protein
MLTRMSEREGDAYLQKRYGKASRGSRPWLIPAIVMLVVGGSWLIWSANHYAKPEIRTQIISFKVINNAEISLRYSISVRTAKRSHQCILSASDYQANLVGQVTDTLPSGSNF